LDFDEIVLYTKRKKKLKECLEMEEKTFKLICPQCQSDNVQEYAEQGMGEVYIIKKCECGYKEEKSY